MRPLLAGGATQTHTTGAEAAQADEAIPEKETADMNLQPGNVVERADGTRMTVERAEPKRAFCIFFRVSSKGEKLMRAWYPTAGLTLVKDKEQVSL